MRKKIFGSFVFLLAFILMTTTAQAAPASPPGPLYPAPDLIVSPATQNIGTAPGGLAVWYVTLHGGSGTYKVTVTWGDSCGSYTVSNWQPNTTKTISHTFDCGYATTYNQTWKAAGLGGPIYEYSVVKR